MDLYLLVGLVLLAPIVVRSRVVSPLLVRSRANLRNESDESGADKMTKDTQLPVELSLLGGPLHRLGMRLGLVRGTTNTLLIGLMLGPALWVVFVALALIEGVEDKMFELALVAGHARLLVIIPLFFACESWVAPRMTAFVATIARTGVVPPAAQPALHAEVSRINRWTNWWWPEALSLLGTLVMDATGSSLQTYGLSAAGIRPATRWRRLSISTSA